VVLSCYTRPVWRPSLRDRQSAPATFCLRALSLCLAVVLAGAVRPAFADRWYEHYARAEEALDDGDWQGAVAELNEAIERKGDSGGRARTYGMKVVAYFPYLRLGVAYYHLGQLDAALRAFETEEQLGAIQSSPDDLAQLERYRGLVMAAQQAEERARKEEVARIVRASISDARALAAQQRLEAALDALSPALAVEPENPEAVTLMEQIRAALLETERRREEESRAALLVSSGRDLLAAGDYSAAARALRQAQAVMPSAETQDLLTQAEARIRAAIETERAHEGVLRGLEEARSFADRSELTSALDALQPVLAVEPDNVEAKALLARLLDADQRQRQRELIQTTIAAAQKELESKSFERAISKANQALALEAGNPEALEVLRRSYLEINRRLLGSGAEENLPPAIRFADLRSELEDGSRAQRVRDPQVRVTGVVIDSTPVSLSVHDSAGAEVDVAATNQPLGELFITEFQIDARLTPGADSFRVVASDSAGLSSSSEYQVVYEPPLIRSRSFVAASIGLACVALGGYGFTRHRRRRTLMRRRFNPYVAGAPVLDEDLFYGREQLIRRILQTIHNNSLLLYGERRIGKTSLQHHLKRRLELLEDPCFAFFPVYVDLQGTPEERFFATLGEDIFHDLAPVLAELEPSQALISGEEYGYRELVSDVRRVLGALQATTPKKVKLVLLIDEVDELNDYDPRTSQKLRSLFMKSFADSLVAVVSGVEIRRQWEKEGSPWYNFFEEIEVTGISREAAGELVRRPIQGVFKLQTGVIDRILDLTDCKPYLIQRTCISLVSRLHDEGRRTITLADIDAIRS
jgi:tetratricopeptide (TPR) repeat protein